MAMNDSHSKALSVMADEGVTAIGIYSSSGRLYQRLGDAPGTLPISKLVQGRRSGEDSTMGIYFMDEDEKEIEYFRLSRLNVIMETGASLPISRNNVKPLKEALYSFIEKEAF